MAINPETQYPGKIAPSTPQYPYGAARNITIPGDGTGTPWEAAIVNDLLGFQQSLLTASMTVPTGTPDQVGSSQYLAALAILGGRVVPTLQDLIDAKGLVKNTPVYVAERETGWGGGAWWDIVGAGDATDNGINVVTNTESSFKLVLRENSQVNVRSLGMIPDGRDNTAAWQKALDKWYNVYIPKGFYESKAVTVALDGTSIHGDGATTRVEYIAGEVGTLLECADKKVTLRDFRLFGGLTSTQKSNDVISASRDGLSLSTQIDSIVDGVTVDGFAHHGMKGNDVANGLWERFTLTNSTFKNNHTGVNTGQFGEYTRYNNNDITSNYIGIAIRPGNVIVNSNKIAKNGIGVFLDGAPANDGHGNLVGNTINHNDFPIFARDIDNGFNCQGNQIFEGTIKIENCVGIMIHGGIINATEFLLDSQGGANYIMRNEMFPSYGNTITRVAGDATLLIDNFFNDGTYLGDITSRKIVAKEAGVTIDLDGITTYPTWKSSATVATSSTSEWGQTGDSACTWDNNNATRPYKYKSSGNDKFTIHNSNAGGIELHDNGSPIITRSADGTAYKLVAPNGGGPATWVPA